MADEGVICPECGSTEVIRYGVVLSRTKGDRQRFLCRGCARTFLNPEDYCRIVRVITRTRLNRNGR